ncbi:MAG: SIS domain-containing protein [Candidatus Nitrohelix vancouverensis]|uniref:SIS domain-containing protein n=1 Tax=Candidatus Nitrohelix vancouverensis TaxID=2705534 RepID=A0A7T0C2H9_9BACT|nr:MAG: SIS domain-containing protein [Candidatus Nitrohelix vancouverensis]
MKHYIESYFQGLQNTLRSLQASDSAGEPIEFISAVETVAQHVIKQSDAGHKIIFIGNGASAAIASHMSTDYWKNGGVRAQAFNDSSLLTCISNDYGYKHVFEKPIEMFSDPGDILFAISSSGKSENILRGVEAARLKNCQVITFSGFKDDNPLRAMGDINFYAPSPEYGPVEILHLSICHCIIDTIITSRKACS